MNILTEILLHELLDPNCDMVRIKYMNTVLNQLIELKEDAVSDFFFLLNAEHLILQYFVSQL